LLAPRRYQPASDFFWLGFFSLSASTSMEWIKRFAKDLRRDGIPRRTPPSSSTTSAMAASMASTSLSARQGYAPARVAARAGAKPVSAARAPLRVVAGESRIGKHAVPVPKGVTYTLKDNLLAVKVRARPLSRTDSYGAARCGAITRSRRRPRPTPVASVRAASDRVLGFWLALFLTISSRLSAARLTGSQGRARIPVPRPHGHD